MELSMRLALTLLMFCFLPSLARGDSPDPRILARRIDDLLAQRIKSHDAKAAPLSDDAEFLRRVSLDLTGRIPLVSDIRQFLADKNSDKRQRLIRTLLDE